MIDVAIAMSGPRPSTAINTIGAAPINYLIIVTHLRPRF